MKEKTIRAINRIGSVVIATLTSFLVLPPVLQPESQSPVNWRHFLTFFAGVLATLVYDLRKKKQPLGLYLILLLLLVGGYEWAYNNSSVECLGGIRCVISGKPVRPDQQTYLDYWEKHSSDPIQSLLSANRCSSIKVWEMSDLAMPYYGMLVLYFLIMITLVLLLVCLGDKTFTK